MTWYSQRLVTGIVRAYTRSNQNATVRIMRMAEPVAGLDGDLDAVASGVVYQGRGRVYSVSGPVQYMLGDEPQYFSSTNISVPDLHEQAAADGVSYAVGDPVTPRIDDIVEVLTHHDARTQGRKFRVTDVAGAGQFSPFVVMQTVGVAWSKRWHHPSADDVDLVIPPEWVIE